jgi:hypothetical protein
VFYFYSLLLFNIIAIKVNSVIGEGKKNVSRLIP